MPAIEVAKLLEREKEVEALSSLIESVKVTPGNLAVIEGPPGIGKTRLLREAQEKAIKSGYHALIGRGSPLERTLSWGIVRQLFEPQLMRRDSKERRRLLAGAAEGAEIALYNISPQVPAGGDFSILHGLYWLTINLSYDHPLILLIDDLQWADVASLRFLKYALHRLDQIPVFVICSVRSGSGDYQDGAGADILNAIVADCDQVLTPRPLSLNATRSLTEEFEAKEPADPSFIKACHDSTGGNPLLLNRLLPLAAEHLNFTAKNSHQILQIGPQAVARHVAAQLSRLPSSATALAQAVAIIGDEAPLSYAAELADLGMSKAASLVASLQGANILSSAGTGETTTLQYVHPLVQATVYKNMAADVRESGHIRAAELLSEGGASAEKAAAHLLSIPLRDNPDHFAILRLAAGEASRRGSPDAAYVYLRRLVEYSAPKIERLEILIQTGLTAVLVDMQAASQYLLQAISLSEDSVQRARIAEPLARVLYARGEANNAISVCLREMKSLGPSEDDLRRRLHAELLFLSHAYPGYRELAIDLTSQARTQEPLDSEGGWMLDRMLAAIGSWQGEDLSGAVVHAQRGLPHKTQLAEASSGEACMAGCVCLLAAERSEAAGIIEASLAEARHHGYASVVGAIHLVRALARLWAGDLSGAEVDTLEAKSHLHETGYYLFYLHAIAFHAVALAHQGRLNEADDILKIPSDLPKGKHQYWLYDARAQLRRAQGRYEEAAAAAREAGLIFSELGCNNPAYIPWRSELALCLQASGDIQEAHEYAIEELDLARKWGSPRALGRSLRVAGLVSEGSIGLPYLEESVKVLEHSEAKLEYARALVDLGAAVRRSNHKKAARIFLRQAADLARQCQAKPLEDAALIELKVSGARPKRSASTGMEALTPSESRIVQMVASGLTNREVAQSLFVTPKTVEVHLSNTYRKLGIASRRELRNVTGQPDSHCRT
ncbi:helix-turn-helix transcriptional regulator [Streptomyces avermitilis]|uniref:helix-turn-helix transcriptional regulator n=1 Tax=Streptomyces avermitilis TaxID=33903 RepID=UPI00382FE6BF